MVRRYKFIRVDAEGVEMLNKRIEQNNKELTKMGLRGARIPQIEFTKFLFKTPIRISDKELKQMARKKHRGRKC